MWRRKQRAGDSEAARVEAPEGQHAEDASYTESYTAEDFVRDQQIAQRNALDGAEANAVSPDAPGQSAEEQLGWCSVNGVFAGMSGGALGAVFGLGSKLITHRGPGRLKAARGSAASNAKSFAVMGGIYAAVTCWATRIRQRQDAYNSALAGGVTGLVLGWGGGPAAAAQSAIGFAAFSFVMDKFQMAQEAEAAAHPGSPAQVRRHCAGSGRKAGSSQPSQQRQVDGLQQWVLEACAAADSYLQPADAFIQAAVTPAAAMLRPMAAALAPCSAAAPAGTCRRAVVSTRRRQRSAWRR